MTLLDYLLIVFSFMFISQLHGSCFFDLLKSESTQNASGHKIIENYCEYSGIKYAVNRTWTLPYPDCFNCECSENGLECCGYGPAAGVMDFPENCELAKNTCKFIVVRKDDPSQPCDDPDPVKSTPLSKRIKHHLKRKNLTIKIHNTRSGFILN